MRSRRRASLTPRPSARAARATRPSPLARASNSGSAATPTMTATASTAGRMVSAGESDGVPTPSHSTTPTTATAAKLAAHLMRKKATLRVATCSVGMPPRRSAHTPRASPPSPPAGHQRADAELRQADLDARAQRHALAEDRPEHEHVARARGDLERDAQHQPAGSAWSRRERIESRPGASHASSAIATKSARDLQDAAAQAPAVELVGERERRAAAAARAHAAPTSRSSTPKRSPAAGSVGSQSGASTR